MDNSLVVQLGINIQKLEEGLNKSNSLLNGFQNKVGDLGKSLVAAFAVERVAEFGFEVTKLAGQYEGVDRVFKQLKNSSQVLNEMREATQGTVADLELMKYAVQADNFNIPISQMGSLFEFAHQRAIATGQSVDYLVQSIVTGIGRKSPLILDNLGISAVTLREKLKGVGTETASVADVAKVVGEIAEESLNKFGRAAETNASKIEAIGASWENLKVKIGQVISSSGVLAKSLEYLNLLLSHMGADKEKPLTKLQDANLALRAALDFYNQDQKKGIDLLFAATQQAEKYGFEVKEIRDANGKLVQIYAEEKKKIEENAEVQKEAIKNIAFYEEEIKNLRESESQLVGQELSDTQRQIELESQKLELLKNQYALERDRANSAQLSKMSNKDMGVSGLGTASIGLPPSQDMDKVAASVAAARKELEALSANAFKYNKSWDIAFNQEAIKQFVTVLHNGMVGMVTDLAAGLGELAAGASTSNQIFSTLLSGVGSMAIQLGQIAIGVAIGIAAIDEALTSLNPAVALAAGIALVALGAAVKGAAANVAKGGSGSSVSGSVQGRSSFNTTRDNSPVMIGGTVKISGQDLWVVLSNYQTNNQFTKFG